LGLPHAVEALPVLLHTAVFLFFAALVDILTILSHFPTPAVTVAVSAYLCMALPLAYPNSGPFQQVTMPFNLDAIRHVVRFIYERPSVIAWKVYGRVIYKLEDLSSAVDLLDEDRVGGVRCCQTGDIIARPLHPTPRRTRFGVRIAHPSWTSSTVRHGARGASKIHKQARPPWAIRRYVRTASSSPSSRATRSPHLPKHGQPPL